ncbi:hypothetical protein NLI96_g10908 [Meripilus lineatus]|uniref:Uncharacterized protein n=1 Tax=Meripilus lineatus TaxID=2056292 RepID=A0AAD5USV6_9APHY|nr:hypothetical protein NLI96_g10908 [Physisporinus lineatus]
MYTPPTENIFDFVLKGIFIRGLFETWYRSPSGSDVATLAGSFITVQLNALLDLAKTQGSDQFSPSWPGPMSETFLPLGQLVALDVFDAAVGMANPSPTSSTSSGLPIPTASAPDPTFSPAKNSKAGLIAGVTVASSVSAILLFVVLFLWIRKRDLKAGMKPPHPPVLHQRINQEHVEAANHVIEPYTLHTRQTLSNDFGSFREKRTPVISAPPEAGPSSRGTSSVQNHEHPSGTRTGTTQPAFDHATSPDRPTDHSNSGANHNFNVPDLIQRLTQALANVSSTRRGMESDDPPEYEQ